MLVDTERDGHRVSFNEAFKQKGRCCPTAAAAGTAAATAVVRT